MATYTETKVTLDEIAQKSRALLARKANLLVAANQLVDEYTAMQTKYVPFSTQLDTDATANLGDAVWQNGKAEKDKLLAEFVENKNNATAIRDAIAATIV